MEYFKYMLVILAILVSCFMLVRVPARPVRRLRKGDQRTGFRHKENQPPHESKADSAEIKKLTAQRKMLKTPTPWGWPGHNGAVPARKLASLGAREVHGVSESLHQFVDRLFKEKHTVEDREYLLRKNASLRALVEDRYGRASTLQDIPSPGSKAPKPAHLRRPVQALNGKKAIGIAAKESAQRKPDAKLSDQTALRKSSELKEIKRPWGW
ncbi:MAG: hypothetical protein HKN57_00880 [Xanthomonadales bacterium]|nr:hypothetical protein [Xanthomonadales bacterium]